ncbi:hypothetical protein K493DRAFT_366141 [Basidiobolus meristosporus CBS 931.73]|uniref:Calcium-channel protein CCH1 n=1 Tax=Basidiobolus meristosporus CBS 931.73 TaxID=1314790 RepID=A0A1Y1YM29_9FUNG|nr:hypothetical protein K493DRAFT_366141 [Basidiobolus meristosporus CBS 931.73]|eukprot:ORX99055.1 hypothetical protein K493DRAFT_366141 [Basidiobolus meristosporus CBS 931.73]
MDTQGADNRPTFRHSRVGSAIQRASVRIIRLTTTRFDNAHEESSQESSEYYPEAHRLGGRSLYIFSPNNRFRIFLAKLFNKRWMGLFITLLILHNWLLLCIQFWDAGVRDYSFGANWAEYPLLVIFIFYTLEMIARIIISGFVFNPIGLQPRNPRANLTTKSQFLVVDVHSELDSLFPDKAYLRHSFQRIDFVVVVSYWINLVLLFTGHGRFTVFVALSALRPFRLISLTSGSWGLSHSRAHLTGVALLKTYLKTRTTSRIISPFRRDIADTMIVSPRGMHAPVITNAWYSMAFCTSTKSNGTLGFDNIFQSVPILFGITAAQGWLDLMFQTMDAEYSLPSALYYIIGVVIFNFWLLNLFVAVITEMFAKIREDTNHSAFISTKTAIVLNDNTEEEVPQGQKTVLEPNFLERHFEITRYFWVLLVAADLVIMCIRSYDPDDEEPKSTVDPTMSKLLFSNTPRIQSKRSLVQGDFLIAERVFTGLFAIEIVLRYFATRRPDRHSKFCSSKRNRLDLFLAVITCIIQIPPIPTAFSGMLYRYFTVFQIARFYRIVMVVPRIRKLIARTVGNVVGMMNLFLFIVICIGVSATVLFGGQIQSSDNMYMNFDNFAASFLALFQIFSGDNWTDTLFSLPGIQRQYNMAVFSSVFILLFFCFSNFILLNMFVAVIVENFEMDEEQKRKMQLEETVKRIETRQQESQNVISPKALEVDSIPSNLVLPVQKRAAREFLQESNTKVDNNQARRTSPQGFTARLRRFFHGKKKHAETRNNTSNTFGTEREDSNLDRTTYEGNTSNEHYNQREAILNDFMTAHPTYDTSLFIFKRNNPIRRFCKVLVGNSDPSIETFSFSHFTWSHLFNGFILICVIVSVVFAALNTPFAQRERLLRKFGRLEIIPIHHRDIDMFFIVDIIITIIFTLEFLIRVIADGFLFTPDAYWKSVWNRVDFSVLITLYITLAINPKEPTGIPRTLRAAKGFRALRIASYFSAVREVFYGTLYSGLPRIIDAVLLSLCFILPFSIYGLNLFAGLMYSCNDTAPNILTRGDCKGLYFDATIKMWKPRVWSNPDGFNFDSFRSSLLVLFEIVSNEGWVDVMLTTMKVKGYNIQPEDRYSWYNAIFFMLYNIVGAVFVLTLFVAVIIENFNTRNGTAFLTAEQRRWIDMKNQLKQIKPSIRPLYPPRDTIRQWCYKKAIEKNGFLFRFVVGVTIFDALLLVTQYHGQPEAVNTAKDILFGLVFLGYIFEIGVKCLGLGVKLVLMNPWNVFDIVITFGLAISTVSQLFEKFIFNTPNGSRLALRIFVTLVLFKVVQKVDSLHQLLRSMFVSLRTIVNLLAVWFLLFVIYAIAFMEIFSLTKMGENGGAHANFRTFANSILNLAGMSTGEGWNSFMHDFVVQTPECVGSARFYLETDCGSPVWAYFLFISFNVISMYIFANLFVVVVMDGFSYCYQIASSYSLMKRDDIRKYPFSVTGSMSTTISHSWSEVDIHGNGYIYQKDIVKLLSKLSTPFDVKIYPDEYSVTALLRDCCIQQKPDLLHQQVLRNSSSKNVIELIDRRPETRLPDLTALNIRLTNLNPAEIRQRKQIYNLVYQEAMDLGVNGRKISFTKMLLLLSIYKLTDPVKSFLPTDYIKRKERVDQIVDKVRLDTLKGFLRIAVQKKRLRDARRNNMGFASYETSSNQTQYSLEVSIITGPEIVIDEEELLATEMRSNYTSSPGMMSASNNDRSPSYSPYPGYSDESDDDSISSLNHLDKTQADGYLCAFRENQWHDILQENTDASSTEDSEEEAEMEPEHL